MIFVRRLATARVPKGSSKKALLPKGWEAVIGIECHAQLTAPTKLFSGESVLTATKPPAFDAPQNTLVAPFDVAYPGTLPRMQDGVVDAALRAALALNCTIAPLSTFDRKHYFYPDLPSGYQITQQYRPFATDGSVQLRVADGHLQNEHDELQVPVTRVQLEQDTAKTLHFEVGGGQAQSFLDYNRAGVALVEIVSAPVMHTPEHAGAYVRKLRELLRSVGASDGNMNEGSLRCDVNVSIHRIGDEYGVRCELKNLNSIRFMMHAISYEVQRQYDIIASGGTVDQESRGFDEARGTTYLMRGKADAPDYRYMPDPNIPALSIDERRVGRVRESLPELPDARHDRLRAQYGLSVRDVNVLTRINAEDDVVPTGCAGVPSGALLPHAVDYFERLVLLGAPAQAAVNWVAHELLKQLNAASRPFTANPVVPETLVELIALVSDGVITASTGRELLGEMVRTAEIPVSVRDVVVSRGLERLATRETLMPLCEEIAAERPEDIAAIRGGRDKAIMRLVGEVMRRAGGRADAALATDLLREIVAR
ncbi:hypothetical protein MCUN1_001732 [Malassezia cuniculi]|uniref:Glutamyl-tRNA(Gln) amidotransferase subunit B, mitochondrial n=1 Tax=Malassezia cuniculi TaxID=948313 RepID=A0AAF0J652_9BASI|nr:hypothetical protein MCUN1_001732 [Malassezia cuniculi]